MIIDMHTHGLHGGDLDRLADVGGDWTRKLIDTERKRAKERPQYLDVALRVAQLDQYGIDIQVVTPGNWMDIYLLPGDVDARLA